MSLKIFLLGQFKLLADNRPLELPSRPAQSLLAYLALNAGVIQRREKLAGLLWPDTSESNARGYLRQALWRIRKCLESATLDGEDYLQISNISVTFVEESDYWLDAEQLLGAAESLPVEDIIEIVRLYQGELLPGFYEEWVLLERDRLGAAYHQKMNLLLERLLQAGKLEDALEWSEEWLRQGSAPEPAFRAMMQAHANLGDIGMVSAAYQRCIETLQRDLGLDPSPETAGLYEHILQGGHRIRPPVSRTVDQIERMPPFLDDIKADPVEKSTFVAREKELLQLDEYLKHAIAGQGRVVFVTGEAGSGKTALIQEFTQKAQIAHHDLIVAGGNCNAHTGIGDPYLPFREVLELLSGNVTARWAAGAINREHSIRLWNALPLAAKALVESGPDLIDTFVNGNALVERAAIYSSGREGWFTRLRELVERKAYPAGAPSLQQSDIFEQYTRVLSALARDVTLVFVVDDLQWADLGSISLLFHLGGHLAGNRILILGAYRSEEVALGRSGERHPLEPVVNELQRLFGNVIVDVDQAERRAFVEAFLDNEPNQLGSAFREMLYRQTRGQPLFMTELLRGMQERGDLVQDAQGRWIEGPTLDWDSLPARVEAVIAERIDRLAHPLQTALQVASVEGEVFTAEVVARVCGCDEHDLLGKFSGELDRKHHLIRAESIQRIDGQLRSCYRFRHILVQRYLYGILDEVERVHLHEQVGTLLEQLFGDQQDISAFSVQLARHFQEARMAVKAIQYLLEAGERAVVLCAHQEAIAHLTKGLDLLLTQPDSPERAEQELSLQIALGMARIGIPDSEWENACNRALELSRRTNNKSQLCRGLGALSIFHYVRAEHEKARKMAEEALMMAEDIQDSLFIALGHWYLGFVLISQGEFKTAQTHLDQVIASYEPKRLHLPLVHLRGVDAGLSAIAYAACCKWCLGFPDQAFEQSRKALTYAQEMGHPFSLADVLCYGGCEFNSIRKEAKALQSCAEKLARLALEKVPAWEGPGIRYRGEALVMLGQFQEGIARLRQSIEIGKSAGSPLNFTGTLGTLAEALANAGQPESGMTTLTEAFALVDETGERYREAELHRLKGKILLMQGDQAQAETSFQKALEVARRQGAKSWELRAATDLARFWQEKGWISEARSALAEVYNWFSEGFDTPDLREARELLEELA